jgi:hypothetical protein
LALPVVTVLVVTYALLLAGVPRSVVGARVYGGPTEGATLLALRIECVQREGERESPIWNGPLEVLARAATNPALTSSIPHAVDGVADFRMRFALPVHGALSLALRDASGSLLAEGNIALDGARWAARARRRGGWIRGRAESAIVLSIAPERGAFVIGSADPLAVRVERAGKPVGGLRLSVSAQGARLSDAENLRTDERGRARFGFEPTELNPTLRVEATADDGEHGLIDSGVPVVPGGLHALVTPSGVQVESAAPRSEAFFSVVSDSGRLTGGMVALAADARGGSLGTVELPEALPHPAWLVLSSEVDQNTAAAIGWPLDVGAEPAQTFDVPEVLLLDGLPAAFRREQERRSRVRWLSAAFIALAFALSVVLLVVRVRAADRDISRHLSGGLEADAVARIAPRRLLSLLVAVLAIALGFIALGLIVAARSR